MRISLSRACELITKMSGIQITRKQLWHQVKIKKYPGKIYFQNPEKFKTKQILLEQREVLMYAENFNGIVRGRPFVKKLPN